MNKKERIQQLFERLSTNNPHPTTELHYTTPFELLIAVMLSAQATDKSVNKVTDTLFHIANTPNAFLALTLDGLLPYLQSLNLYKTKAKHVIETCQILIEKHGGIVPNDRESLEALRGVGRKTANVVLNTAFGEPTMAVDTHIFRVANRLAIATGKTPLAVEKGLLKNIPAPFLKDAHHWLILHGRYCCKAKSPLCHSCILSDLCPSYPLSTSLKSQKK